MNTIQSPTVHSGGIESAPVVQHAVVPTPEVRVFGSVLEAAQEHAGVIGTPEFVPVTSQGLVMTDLIYAGSPPVAPRTFGLPD